MERSIAQKLEDDGFVVLEEFLKPSECEELIEASSEFYADLPSSEHVIIFSTAENNKHQIKEKYFMESNDKIRCFYEMDAVGPNGEIIVKPELALNKVGHALHLLHPIFRCYTYCDRVLKVVKQLDFEEPAVAQSMYIYKNPRIGGEVAPHQDASYLYTEPKPPVGFWIALEDATVNNGCLWVAQGSHTSGVHRRLIRSHENNTKEILVYDRPAQVYSASTFKAVPVKKGTCILLHGNIIHKSAQNVSNKSRPAYTFHVIEKRNNTYSSDNWLQEGKAAPFCNMYTTQQFVEDICSPMIAKVDDSKNPGQMEDEAIAL